MASIGFRSACGLAAVLALAAAAAASAQPTPAAGDHHDPNSLLRQMRACLAQVELAPPCTAVDRARGFVVIKDHDPAKPFAWLIVPTTDVTGIEDPAVLRPPVLEFWTYGWEMARALLDRPDAEIGLAINSKAGRSQDLLHIHISCVLPSVRTALAGGGVAPQWASEPFVFFGESRYNARRVAGLVPSPFRLLRELPQARADMGSQSLAVIGATGGGYYLLADITTAGNPAEAEELLDESCR